jgi:hypothetical protein
MARDNNPDDFDQPDELNDEGGIEIPFDDVRGDEDLEKSALITDGSYHVVIDSVTDHVARDRDASGAPKKSYKFSLQILDGEDPSMAGRFLYHYLGKGATALSQQRLIAVRLGLVGREVYGKSARVDFKDAVGAQCVVVVKSQPAKDGFPASSKIPFNGWYDVWDERVAGVPKDESQLPPRPTGASPPARTEPEVPPHTLPTPRATGNGTAPPAGRPKGKAKKPPAQNWEDLA